MNRVVCLFAIIFLTSCASGGLWNGYILDSSDDVILSKIPANASVQVADKNTSIPEDYLFIRFNLLNDEDAFLEAYISPKIFERRPMTLGGVRDSGYYYRDGDPYGGWWIRSAINVHTVCQTYTNDICLIDEFNGNNFLTEALENTCTPSNDIYSNYQYQSRNVQNAERCQPFLKEHNKKKMMAEAKQKEEEEEKRVAVLVALKERCLEYGFTGNNNIASCIQREAQHDFEIEQQKYQVALLEQQLASQNNQANTTEEIPFWMDVLGAFAEGLSEGYKQAELIKALDSRYLPKTRYIYRDCGYYSCTP